VSASPKNEKRLESIKEDILFDIYMYEKELSASNLKKEDIVSIQDKIARAEELFKTVE